MNSSMQKSQRKRFVESRYLPKRRFSDLDSNAAGEIQHYYDQQGKSFHKSKRHIQLKKNI